jgi:hypothetical protein
MSPQGEGRGRKPGQPARTYARFRKSPAGSLSGATGYLWQIRNLHANQQRSRSLKTLCFTTGDGAIKNRAGLVKKLWTTILLCAK